MEAATTCGELPSEPVDRSLAAGSGVGWTGLVLTEGTPELAWQQRRGWHPAEPQRVGRRQGTAKGEQFRLRQNPKFPSSEDLPEGTHKYTTAVGCCMRQCFNSHTRVHTSLLQSGSPDLIGTACPRGLWEQLLRSRRKAPLLASRAPHEDLSVLLKHRGQRLPRPRRQSHRSSTSAVDCSSVSNTF